MKLLSSLVLVLILYGCGPEIGGGIGKEFAPQKFCLDSGGDWKKVSKTTRDPGTFDLGDPDYNWICECPAGSYWTDIGCKEPCFCTAEYDPVCGEGKTYSNACRARCEGVFEFRKGEC